MHFYPGIETNSNGGLFTNGKEYPTLKKVEIEVVYWRLFVALGKSPSERRLACEAKVGKTYARKLINEVKNGGGIIPVERLKEERVERRDNRVGCLCITLQEKSYLLQI